MVYDTRRIAARGWEPSAGSYLLAGARIYEDLTDGDAFGWAEYAAEAAYSARSSEMAASSPCTAAWTCDGPAGDARSRFFIWGASVVARRFAATARDASGTGTHWCSTPEYRYLLWHWLRWRVDFAWFGDWGQVYRDIGDEFELGEFESSFGGGLRVANQGSVIGRIDVAHSEEGTRGFVKFSGMF